ncbi:MAG: hypothetical protein AB4058_01565 [Microcystaceae cyanobacterium]
MKLIASNKVTMKNTENFCSWIGQGEYLGYSYKIGRWGRGKPVYFWQIERSALVGGGYFELARCHLSALAKIRIAEEINTEKSANFRS